MSFRDAAAAAEHAREFWGKRYRDFSLSESGWMGAGEHYNCYLYKCKRQALMRALAQIGLNKNSSLNVLDAGCGQGFFAEVWQNNFPRVSYTGVDICEKVVAHLYDKFPGSKFFAGDLTSWRHPQQKSFDLIHVFHVFLMLLSDAAVEQAILNLTSQLKLGGYMLLTAALPKGAVDPNEYTRHQSGNFWARSFQKAGLKLLFADKMYYWLPDGGPKNRYANKLLRLPGPWLLYRLDRWALRLNLPQMFGGWDSRTKLLILQRT